MNLLYSYRHWPLGKQHAKCRAIPQDLMIGLPNGNIFRVTGLLRGEFTHHWWIPHRKASDAEPWCFFICAWTNNWANNEDAGELIRHCAHYDVVVMSLAIVNDVICWPKGELTRSCIWHVYKLRLRQCLFSINTVNIHKRWRDNIKVVTYSYGAHAILIVNIAV